MKLCKHCDQPIKNRHPLAEYCSKTCKNTASHITYREKKRQRNATIEPCPCCGVKFIKYNAKKKYCSSACKNKTSSQNHRNKVKNANLTKVNDTVKHWLSGLPACLRPTMEALINGDNVARTNGRYSKSGNAVHSYISLLRNTHGLGEMIISKKVKGSEVVEYWLESGLIDAMMLDDNGMMFKALMKIQTWANSEEKTAKAYIRAVNALNDVYKHSGRRFQLVEL